MKNAKIPAGSVLLLLLGAACVAVVSPYGLIGLAIIAAGLWWIYKIYYSAAVSNRNRLEECESKLKSAQTNGFDDYVAAQEKLEDVRARYEQLAIDFNLLTEEYEKKKDAYVSACKAVGISSDLQELSEEYEKRKRAYVSICKQSDSVRKKLSREKEIYAAYSHATEQYVSLPTDWISISAPMSQEADELSPSILLQVHSMDLRDLSAALKENDKTITDLSDRYRSRYTTKTNQTIYNLMVIALRAELQNVLVDLRYQKLDRGIEHIKEITQKYMGIVAAGNQQLTTTMTLFVGSLEHLFINAVKIEYSYYLRKEQARQEQLAIRERMRQEAEEQRALKLERERIEKEEAKFTSQIDSLKSRMAAAAAEEIAALQARIVDLEAQQAEIVLKKEKITALENGKAGNVYIISNLGSFGDHIFKIGMTRRFDPQERIDELGSASVPFRFDVHSFIFSNDAAALEAEIHRRLDANRVNKVNPRKEFFDVSLDELERITREIAPTAEFHRTMAAEEYRHSQSDQSVAS